MSNPHHLSAAETQATPEQGSPAPGPRKLVRPRLPGGVVASNPRAGGRRTPPVLLAHHELAPAVSCPSTSHAELFYFQKQIQAQTPLVFVLDDGERIEGVIEWYDQNVIKVRHTTRTMIYKHSIKYLFKAADAEARRQASED